MDWVPIRLNDRYTLWTAVLFGKRREWKVRLETEERDAYQVVNRSLSNDELPEVPIGDEQILECVLFEDPPDTSSPLEGTCHAYWLEDAQGEDSCLVWYVRSYDFAPYALEPSHEECAFSAIDFEDL